jgi:Ca2+-binding RTX toxin-like protein
MVQLTSGNDIQDNAASTSAETIEGLAGDDIITAGSGADSLLGGLGNDTLLGQFGNDTILGNDGTETSASDNDRLIAGAGSDSVGGDSGSDTIFGGFGIVDPGDASDTLRGGGGTDTIYGNGGDDEVTGNNGSDLVFGGIGRDLIFGGNDATGSGDAADELYGNAGEDTIYGGEGADTIYGGDGVFNPADAADFLYGGANNDIIFGNGGGDSISGEAGNDSLIGGMGSDTLNGGSGSDNFFVHAPLSPLEAANQTSSLLSVIEDFRDAGSDILSIVTNESLSFSDLTITQNGTSTDIVLPGAEGYTIRLLNTTTDQVTDGNVNLILPNDPSIPNLGTGDSSLDSPSPSGDGGTAIDNPVPPGGGDDTVDGGDDTTAGGDDTVDGSDDTTAGGDGDDNEGESPNPSVSHVAATVFISNTGSTDKGSILALDEQDIWLDADGKKLSAFPESDGNYTTERGAIGQYSNDNGTHHVSSETWNYPKTILIEGEAEEFAGESVKVTNFVDANFILNSSTSTPSYDEPNEPFSESEAYELLDDYLADSVDTEETHVEGVDVVVDGAKRGEIITSSGDDAIKVGSATNEGMVWNNVFEIDSKAGHDSIILTEASEDAVVGSEFEFNITDGPFTKSIIIAGEGDDSVDSSILKSKDTVEGGYGNDVIQTGGGEDHITGGFGNDTLTGGTDADIFYFNEVVEAEHFFADFENGLDLVEGDIVNGTGEDIFEFSVPIHGEDVITDFENGFDLLNLSNASGVSSINDLEITSQRAGADTLITDKAGIELSILLEGVESSTIDTSDFIF